MAMKVKIKIHDVILDLDFKVDTKMTMDKDSISIEPCSDESPREDPRRSTGYDQYSTWSKEEEDAFADQSTTTFENYQYTEDFDEIHSTVSNNPNMVEDLIKRIEDNRSEVERFLKNKPQLMYDLRRRFSNFGQRDIVQINSIDIDLPTPYKNDNAIKGILRYDNETVLTDRGIPCDKNQTSLRDETESISTEGVDLVLRELKRLGQDKPEESTPVRPTDSMPEESKIAGRTGNMLEESAVAGSTNSKPESRTVVGPTDSKPEESKVDGPTGNKPEESKIAGPTGNKPEESKVAGPTGNKPEESAVAGPTDSKPGEGAVAEPTGNKPREGAVAEPTGNKPKESTVAEQTDNKPEESEVAGPTNIKLEESAVAEPTDIKLEESTVAEPTGNRAEESAVAGPTDNKPEESAVAGPTDNKPEESAVAGPTDNKPKESTVVGPTDSKTEESAVAEPTGNRAEESAVAGPTGNKPKDSTVAEPTYSKPKDSTVAEPTYSKPKDRTDAEPTGNKPEESTVDEPTGNKPEESAVAGPTDNKPEESAVAGPTDSKTEESAVAEPTDIKPEESTVAGPTNIKPEESAVAGPTDSKTEESAVAEPTESKTEKSAVVGPTDSKTEESAVAEPTDIKPEESSVAEPTDSKTEESTVAEPTDIKDQVDETQEMLIDDSTQNVETQPFAFSKSRIVPMPERCDASLTASPKAEVGTANISTIEASAGPCKPYGTCNECPSLHGVRYLSAKFNDVQPNGFDTTQAGYELQSNDMDRDNILQEEAPPDMHVDVDGRTVPPMHKERLWPQTRNLGNVQYHGPKNHGQQKTGSLTKSGIIGGFAGPGRLTEEVYAKEQSYISHRQGDNEISMKQTKDSGPMDMRGSCNYDNTKEGSNWHSDGFGRDYPSMTPDSAKNGNPHDCGVCIGVITDHTFQPELNRDIDELIHLLQPNQSCFWYMTIEGPAVDFMPNMANYELEQLKNPDSAPFQYHETAVHRFVKAMKAEGCTLGHMVKYFTQKETRRQDILDILKKIHPECSYCSTMPNETKNHLDARVLPFWQKLILENLRLMTWCQ